MKTTHGWRLRRPTPARPPADAEVAAGTAVIGKEDMPLDGEPRCRIAFSDAGHGPETLFWEGEPCGEVGASFVDREALIELGDREVLDDHARERLLEGPGGRALHVEGMFAASAFPVDRDRLTCEVTASDRNPRSSTARRPATGGLPNDPSRPGVRSGMECPT
jgi:hypothetical protein